MTIMRIISLRIFGSLVALGVLWVFVPDARSDDATDWANQQAQAQKDPEDWQNQQAQAQRTANRLKTGSARPRKLAEPTSPGRRRNARTGRTSKPRPSGTANRLKKIGKTAKTGRTK